MKCRRSWKHAGGRARNLPVTRSRVCRGRSRRCLSIGSTNISPRRKRRCSAGSGISATVRSTIRAGVSAPKAKEYSPSRSDRCSRWRAGAPVSTAGRNYRRRLFEGRVSSWIYLMRRLREIDAPKNRHHQKTADEAERRHEIKVIAPTLIEQQAEEIARQTSAEILEGIDQPRGETSHARAANVHRRRRSEQGMGRVRRERNQDEKKDGGIGGSKLGRGQNNDDLEKVETRRNGREASGKNKVGDIT